MYGSYNSLEEMDEAQGLQETEEFMNWYHGNKIRGDYKEACKHLKLDHKKEHDYNELERKFFNQPQENEKIKDNNNDLPF